MRQIAHAPLLQKPLLLQLANPVQLVLLHVWLVRKKPAEKLSATAARLAKRTGSRARSARLIYSYLTLEQITYLPLGAD